MRDYSKYLWITAILLIIAAFFVANVKINPQLSNISAIFIIALSVPCFAAMIIWLGAKKGLVSILILSIYALTIETLAIITGFPYSPFHYTNLIGAKILGYTPFTVPFAYVPIFIGCIYLATIHSRNKWSLILKSALLVLIADLVLDPAAVSLKFWAYNYSSIFYGVPLQNFIGWIITGILAGIVCLLVFGSESLKKMPRAIVSSFFLIISFWTAICIFRQLWLPGIIGILLILFILRETKLRVGDFQKPEPNIMPKK
jgi:putative membrane protein